MDDGNARALTDILMSQNLHTAATTQDISQDTSQVTNQDIHLLSRTTEATILTAENDEMPSMKAKKAKEDTMVPHLIQHLLTQSHLTHLLPTLQATHSLHILDLLTPATISTTPLTTTLHQRRSTPSQ